MAKPPRKPVEIPGLDVGKAKHYSRVRLAVLAASTGVSMARLVWLASDRRASRLLKIIEERTPDRRLAAPAFFAAMSAMSWIASLPIDYFGGYQVEKRFALTSQPVRSWLSDQIKALAVGTLIQTPLLTMVYAVIRRRPRDWWLILASAAVPMMVLFSNLAPVLLMPIFNRFVPLRDEELARRLRELAASRGVEVSDVYEVDLSRQSEKPNAMFTGIGNTRRIVLGDTLLERFEHDEIEAVIAHELGHQVHADIWRLIAFGALSGFGSSWLLSRLMPSVVRRTSARTGVNELGDAASLPLFTLAAAALGLVLMPIQAAFSRALERRADRFAIELTVNADAYARAMQRLAVQSLADPDPPRAVVFMLYSHPPVAERIRAALGAENKA